MSEQSKDSTAVEDTAQFNKKYGTELIKRTPIKGTPFVFIENEETASKFIALGRHIIIDNVKSLEEAEKELPNVNNWEVLIKIISAITIMSHEQLINH